MLLVYASRTSNIQRIVQKLNIPPHNLLDISNDHSVIVDKSFFLLTYTDLLGSVPASVESFLSRNHSLLRGVAGSGNRNFGNNFCGAAKSIAQRYGVPLMATFELTGTEIEINEFRKKLMEFEES